MMLLPRSWASGRRRPRPPQLPSPAAVALLGCLGAAAAAEAGGSAEAPNLDADVCRAGERCGEAALQTNPEGYYWRRRGGGNELPTGSLYKGSFNFSGAPAWVWPNERDEQVRHSPLIDDKLDIYISTGTRILKFDRDGRAKWTWETGPWEGRMSTASALYQGTLYAMSWFDRNLTMHAMDMESGALKWKRHLQKKMNADGNALFVYNETILFAYRDHVDDIPHPLGDGNNQFGAMSTRDGALLWEHTVDDAIWNFMPSTPGDGTFLVASQCGGVYRMTWDGELVWRAGRPSQGSTCSCGGGVLGPNGLFYAEFNDVRTNQGVVSAHRVSDGSLVWERQWPGIQTYGGWQYPAVGRLAPTGQLAVVAALGGITAPPRFPILPWMEKPWVPHWLKDFWYHQLYLKSPLVRRWLGVPPLPNAVAALDAETGQTIWWVEPEPPWDRIAMAGDEERYVERLFRFLGNMSREDPQCQPDPQGIPLIAGDGTVYASSSHTGNLFAIRDDDGNGVIEGPGEVSVLKTGIGFLNSPSLAPGMMVIAPCWGPVYVFKDAAAE